MKIDPESPAGRHMIKMMEAGDISKLTPAEMETMAEKARNEAAKEKRDADKPLDVSKLTEKDIEVVKPPNGGGQKGFEGPFGGRRTK